MFPYIHSDVRSSFYYSTVLKCVEKFSIHFLNKIGIKLPCHFSDKMFVKNVKVTSNNLFDISNEDKALISL